MQNAAATSWKIAEEDRLRADLYGFLSALLAAPPDKELLARTALLEGDETPLGRSIAALAKLAGQCGPDAAEREFNALFIGLGRGELLPYASYYMTGFLNEKPLALLRKDMAGLGISRAANVFEPEDNIASLCEMMAGLIVGRFGTRVSLSRQKAFFDDLKGAKGSVFYAPVGAIGRSFMDIEKEAFRMAGDSPA